MTEQNDELDVEKFQAQLMEFMGGQYPPVELNVKGFKTVAKHVLNMPMSIIQRLASANEASVEEQLSLIVMSLRLALPKEDFQKLVDEDASVVKMTEIMDAWFIACSGETK